MTTERQRVLISGGSGFLGTNIVQVLPRSRLAILSLDKAEPRNAAHRCVWRRVDILDDVALEGAFAAFAPDLLTHFVARTDLEGRSLAEHAENIRNATRVARHAARSGARFTSDVLQATRLADSLITSWRLNNLVTYMIYPMAPTAEVAGEPFSVDEGVAKTVAWIRKEKS